MKRNSAAPRSYRMPVSPFIGNRPLFPAMTNSTIYKCEVIKGQFRWNYMVDELDILAWHQAPAVFFDLF